MLKKYGLNTILLGVVIVLLVLVLIKTSPDYVVAQGDGGAGGCQGLAHVRHAVGGARRARRGHGDLLAGADARRHRGRLQRR